MFTKTAFSLAVASLCVCSLARAEQFVLVDLSYTHSTDTTNDSHYYPKLPADTPKDWTKPVDYSKGSVHIVLDVKTKPAGDAPTKFQLCFEGSPSYGCTAQSPTYTKAGRVEWDSPFSGFWYESTVDWSKGVKAMPLILKDDKNNKPAGDPKYMPTELHVQVTLVSAGSKFMPPPAAGSGGSGGAAGAAGTASAAGTGAAGRGAAGAAGSQAGGSGGAAAEAGTSAPAAGSGGLAGRAAAGGAGAPAAGSAAVSGGVAGRAAAGGAGARSDAAGTGATAPLAGAGTTTGSQTAAPREPPEIGGCRAVSGGLSGSGGAWLVAIALLVPRLRRRVRR